MPGKRKAQSAVVRSKAGPKKKKSGKSAKSAKGKRAKSAPGALEGGEELKRDPDILDPIAMEHLYYTAHNVATALELRGFAWEGAPKKKKGKGKKGKKKK